MIRAAAALLLLATPALAEDGCKLVPLGAAVVAAVGDGRTLTLADGRTVRLAGLEVGDAAAALQGLVGRPLRLEAPSAEPDRYGRLVAFAYAGGEARSVQQMLLEQGQARVAARVGSKACADLLRKAEQAARAAQRGLWADPNFAPLSPESSARLRAELGRFAIVQGKVLSVRDSGATIYVNFGPRWTRDFSVIILRRNQRIFKDAGLDPTTLAGRLIRVRGVLEQRRGPAIEADVPEQIELIDDAMRNAETRP